MDWRHWSRTRCSNRLLLGALATCNRCAATAFALKSKSKSVTLNDLERHNGRYFSLFQRIRVASGRTA